MADHLRTELVLDALDMAIAQRNPTSGLVHHSDHGCQYTSFAFGRRLAASELVASMGTVGDALDNAVAESFFATLECELLDRYPWPTRAGLRTAIFDFIEVFYNRQRRHSTLDYHPPAAYEQHHASVASAAQHRVHGNDSAGEFMLVTVPVAGVSGGRPSCRRVGCR
jgi:putative transposase